jgi:hypothetical protein
VEVLSDALRALLSTGVETPLSASSSQPSAIDVLRQRPVDLLTVPLGRRRNHRREVERLRWADLIADKRGKASSGQFVGNRWAQR